LGYTLVLHVPRHVVREIFGVSRLVVRKNVIVARPIARALVLNAFVALLFLLLLLFSKVWHCRLLS
jgi:dolichol kinase